MICLITHTNTHSFKGCASHAAAAPPFLPAAAVSAWAPSRCCLQAALLPLLVRLLGERRLLLLGLVFSAVEQALLATARAKGQAYAAIALGSIASVSFPAISALKSMHVAQDQQGLVQGALAGIRALAAGLGPLAFAQLFAACTRSDAGVVWCFCCGFWGVGGWGGGACQRESMPCYGWWGRGRCLEESASCLSAGTPVAQAIASA